VNLFDAAYRRDLGDGLVLRWSTANDIDRLIELYSTVFRHKADSPASQPMAHWIRDKASGRNPQAGPTGHALVEDTRRQAIVAAADLMADTWHYADVPFTVGRPEPVAAHEDYRNRGLVRALFELLHARSAARGDLVQAITGIPYFYRQFGYEYAIEMGASRSVSLSAIPRLKEGVSEPYTLRDATIDDVPLLQQLYAHERAAGFGGPLLVTNYFSADYWRYMIAGMSPESGTGAQTQLVVDGAGQPQGYLLRARMRWDDGLGVFGFMAAPGASLLDIIPSALRGLAQQGPLVQVPDPQTGPLTNIRFYLGRSHVVHRLLSDALATPQQPPYAWYVRVPDLPAFIHHIRPVLEQRLATSPLAGHSGDLRLTFYRGGLHLAFAQGRLVKVEPWQAPAMWEPRGDAGFPPLVFLQLLFGHRSLAELRHALPDVWANSGTVPLLEVLFPPQPSWLLSQD
jgi:hypothetical protein